MKRKKVLVSAYACSPYRGSEPGVGWGFVAELSKYHELHVIVEKEKFKDEITRYQSSSEAIDAKFYFVQKKRARWLRKIWPPSYYWMYWLWQREVYSLATSLHAKNKFDLIHQLTMVGFREPGFLWKIDVPFVWGPVGGMGLFPWRFLQTRRPMAAAYFSFYNLYNLVQSRLLRRPKVAAARAGAGFIAATQENLDGAEMFWGVHDGKLLSEVGLAGVSERPRPRDTASPLKIIWVGQHTPGKALDIGLRALSRVDKNCNWELTVVGYGTETRRWTVLADCLGIADRVHFVGWCDLSHVKSYYSSADLMMITSLRDLTATVTLEALSFSLPVVCLDHCGFGDLIDHRCGIKITVSNPKLVCDDLAAAIETLEQNESLRMRLAHGAFQVAIENTWTTKVRLVNEIYNTVTLKDDDESTTCS